MAWIQLECDLSDHPKTITTATALKLDKDALVGKLCRLWTWALNNREDGFISDDELGTVAEVMRWTKKPSTLFDALCKAPPRYEHGFIDRVSGGYIIHGWDERVYMLREKREEKRAQDRVRSARYRHKKSAEKSVTITHELTSNHACVTRDDHANHAVTVPIPYQEEEEDACVRVREEPAEDEYGNPLPDPEWQKVSDCYLSQIGMLPSGTHLDSLSSYTDDMGSDVVCLAITETNRKQPSNPKYFLLKILENWFAAGIRDAETAKAYLLDRERKQTPTTASRSPPVKEPEQPRVLKIVTYDDGSYDEVWE